MPLLENAIDIVTNLFYQRLPPFAMSFNDLEAAESPKYTDFPEFEGLSQTIENILYNINNSQLSSLKKYLSQFDSNSSEDKKKLVSKISNLITKTTLSFKNANDNATKLNTYLNNCERNGEDDDTLQYLRQKEKILINLITSSINQFQKHQKKFESIERLAKESATAVVEESSTNAIANPNNPDTGLQHSIQITYEPVNAEELEEQSLLVQEREREIHQISQDITEINDIFLNLHELVNEQQTQIDSIEDNILSYSDDTRGATVELRRAERYQKRSSGRMMCCLAILLGVLAMIILISVIF